MRATRGRVGAAAGTIIVLALVSGCTGPGPDRTAPSSCAPGNVPASPASCPASPGGDDLLVVGRIVTMDEPPIAEALLLDDGVVRCVGTRDEVTQCAGGDVPVLDIGDHVAYPGFIDAHAHWIGDREYYGLDSAEEAMEAALSRGWTSISEQWVNHERLDELTALATDGMLPIRVDAYLALNFGDEFFGDWYADREPGDVGDRLRVRGIKIHLDDGAGAVINWEQDELTGAIGRANDAGWQVSVHSVSTEAQEMLLEAYEAAVGVEGPNPLHHRLEHAIEVSDDQLARIAAMDLVTVVHPDGGSVDWVLWNDYMGQGDGYPPEQLGWLTRMRDFVDAGMHVAVGTDTPWFIPDFELIDAISRPFDQIAGGMDGVGREYPQTTDWILKQLLTAEQGLRAVTVEAAYALGDEARRGKLAPGTLGDLTILSGDVTQATPDEIRAMEVVATIVGGSVAYCADASVCGSID